MNLLNELERFIDDDDNSENIQDVINYANKLMAKSGSNTIDDEIEAELSRMFGSEYISDNLGKIKQELNQDDNSENLQDVINYANKLMVKYGSDTINDEIEAELSRMFGSEYISDNLETIKQKTGLNN